MESESLYIPYGLSIEQEYVQGFGKTELRHFLIGFSAFAAVGALLLLITGNFFTLIVPVIIGAAGTFMTVRKDPVTKTSVVGQTANIIRFATTQKKYYYVYKSQWGNGI